MSKKTRPKAKKKPSKAGAVYTAITSASSPNWSNYQTLNQPSPFLLDVDGGKSLSNAETDKLLIMLGKAVAKILAGK